MPRSVRAGAVPKGENGARSVKNASGRQHGENQQACMGKTLRQIGEALSTETTSSGSLD